MPFFEPGMNELLKKVVKKGNLKATSDLKVALKKTTITIVAVGTPNNNNKTIDLSGVLSICKQIAPILKNKASFHVVTIKSTVVPGTTDNKIVSIFKEAFDEKSYINIGLCYNPEFLREGTAVKDFNYPDRIVIGAKDKKSYLQYSKLFKWAKCPIIKTNLRTAEMIKYSANSFLALLISFSNELASIAEGLGDIDIRKVFKGVCLDQRLSPFYKKHGKKRIRPGIIKYLWPGCGYGGSCLPKDVTALINHAKDNAIETPILKAVKETNFNQQKKMLDWAKKITGSLQEKKAVVLGVSFKPDTDDLRESPAVYLIKSLLEKKAEVWACDPQADRHSKNEIFFNNHINFEKDPKKALKGAHIAFLVTSWDAFRDLKKEDYLSLMAMPNLIDGRLFYNADMFRNSGIRYISLGDKINA